MTRMVPSIEGLLKLNTTDARFLWHQVERVIGFEPMTVSVEN